MQEDWQMANWLEYSLQTKNFSLFWSHTWKYDIEANERLTKVKEKWSTINVDVFVLSFIFFVPMAQTISVKNKIKKKIVAHAIFCNCTYQEDCQSQYLLHQNPGNDFDLQ